MTPHVLSLLPESDVAWFTLIKPLVADFPDGVDFGKDSHGEKVVLSCHILAHAIGKVLNIWCVDGFFHPFYSHSWLKTEAGNVIDVYPVGILSGPILVHDTGNFASPVKHLYEANISVNLDVVSQPWMVSAIKIAEAIIRPMVSAKPQ